MKQDWELKKLGEVCLVERGSSPRPIEKYFTNSEDGLNWIKIGDTKNLDKYIYSTREKITKEGAEKSKHVKKGDFILSNSMSFGKPYIMKTEGYIHDGWFVLRLYNFIDSEYFFHLLSSPLVNIQFHKLASGSVVKNISGDLVKKVILPIPPLPEQQRIVAILDEAFEAIAQAKANAEKNLKNARALFDSYLQSVFENGKWKAKKIHELCVEVFAGGDAPKENFSLVKNDSYQIPVYANAVKERGLYGFTNFARVTKPSITIAARGSGTGHTEIRFDQYFPIVRLIVLIPNLMLINLEFLKYSIDTFTIVRSGSAIPQLTIPMIKEYDVPLPSLLEQNIILIKLDALSTETKKMEALYQQKIDDLEELKKSLLQKAFNGELKTLDIVEA